MLNREKIESSARNAVEWIYHNQCKPTEGVKQESRVDPRWGSFAWTFEEGQEFSTIGPEWVGAFCTMACFAGYQSFKEDKFRAAALLGARYLQTLQIFDPYNQKHYGAFREYTPLSSWCYVRDAVSAGWAMVAMYKTTKEDRFLVSAKSFYDWLLREGLDKYGYPFWGVTLDATGYDNFVQPMNQHLEGVFHGGSLNFFYQMYKATNDKKYIGKEFINLADLLIDRIQQRDGSFATFNTETMKSVDKDPQFSLHVGNDDLNTLGLLCVYEVTKDKKYMDAIEKFISFVSSYFDPKRGFGDQRAALPVILNIMIELEKYNNTPERFQKEKEAIIELILTFQQVSPNPKINGALIEIEGKRTVCARSTQYTALALLKYLGYCDGYIGIK